MSFRLTTAQRRTVVWAHLLAGVLVISTVALLVAGVVDLFIYARDLYAYLGAVIWLTAGLANSTALRGLVVAAHWWAQVTAAAQGFTTFIILFCLKVELNSAVLSPAWIVALLLAALVSIIVVVFALSRTGAGIGRVGTAMVALFPLLGVFQLWLINDYAPRTLRPIVNIDAGVTKVAETATETTLVVRVSLSNEGVTDGAVVGGVVLVETVPDVGVYPTPYVADQDLASAMDWFPPRKDYYPPRSSTGKKILYFNELLQPDNLVPAHAKVTAVEDLIKVPTGTERSIRVVAQLGVVNSERMGAVRSCTLDGSETVGSAVGMDTVVTNRDGVRFVCVDREVRSTTVTEALFGDEALLRSVLIFGNPAQPQLDYPQLVWGYGTRVNLDAGGDAYRMQSTRIEQHNPGLFTTLVKESEI